MLKRSIILLVIASFFIASGCCTICDKKSSSKCSQKSSCTMSECSNPYQYSASTLLEGTELVGAGFRINWGTDTPGTCYYTWNGKIIKTAYIDARHSFSCSYHNSNENRDLRKNLGIPDGQPIITELWFKPDPKPKQ